MTACLAWRDVDFHTELTMLPESFSRQEKVSFYMAFSWFDKGYTRLRVGFYEGLSAPDDMFWGFVWCGKDAITMVGLRYPAIPTSPTLIGGDPHSREVGVFCLMFRDGRFWLLPVLLPA